MLVEIIIALVGVEAVFAGKRHSAVIVSKPNVDNEERKQKKREKLFASMAQSSTAVIPDDSSVGSLDSLEKKKSPTRRKKLTRKGMVNKPLPILDDGEMPIEHKDVYTWGYNAYGELGLGN